MENTRRVGAVLVAVGALLVGVFVGRAIAYQSSLGGLGGAIGGSFETLLLIAMVVGLGLLGLIAAAVGREVSLASATILGAAGLLAIGAVGGAATAAVSGGVHRAPVVLGAPGMTNSELKANTLPFVARQGGEAGCQSVPDSQRVATITALDVGKLGPGTLRATLTLPAPGSDAATAEFWIDGKDLPPGAVQPFWQGSVQVTEISADQSSGRVTFDSLAREPGPEAAKPGSSYSTAATAWPPTLSGALSWACQPWQSAPSAGRRPVADRRRTRMRQRYAVS